MSIGEKLESIPSGSMPDSPHGGAPGFHSDYLLSTRRSIWLHPTRENKGCFTPVSRPNGNVQEKLRKARASHDENQELTAQTLGRA